MNSSGEFKAMSPSAGAPQSSNTSFIMKSIEELDDVIRKRREELDNYRRRQSHGSESLTPISGVFSSYTNTPITTHTHSSHNSRDKDVAATNWALEESTKKKLELESRLTEVQRESATKESRIEQLEREREEYALMVERTVREKDSMQSDLDSINMEMQNERETIHKLESALKVNESRHHHQYLDLKRQYEATQQELRNTSTSLHNISREELRESREHRESRDRGWNSYIGAMYSRTVNLCLLAALQGIAVVLLLLCVYFWLAEESRYPPQGCITIT